MATIAIDCRFASASSGLRRYVGEIVPRLTQCMTEHRFLLLVRSAHEGWIAEDDRVRTIVCDAPPYSVREQFRLPFLLARLKPDLFFVPHFNVPLFCPVPFVLTIHDCILHRWLGDAGLLKRMAYRAVMRHAVRRSVSIIAISAFVKDELERAYGIAAVKTHVVGQGVSDRFSPRGNEEIQGVLSRYGISQPFLLYVGSAKEHKNVRMLLRAYEASDVRSGGVQLVLVTGGREADGLLPPPPGVRMLRGVRDEDMPGLYSAARAFVTASLYEGFCLPIAEAMACGCPVVAVRRTAIPETAAGYALLVEPVTEEFARALAQEHGPRAPMRARSWEETAQDTARIIERAIPVHAFPPTH